MNTENDNKKNGNLPISNVIKSKIDKRKRISYANARELAYSIMYDAIQTEHLRESQKILLNAKKKNPNIEIGDVKLEKSFTERDFGDLFDIYAETYFL